MYQGSPSLSRFLSSAQRLFAVGKRCSGAKSGRRAVRVGQYFSRLYAVGSHLDDQALYIGKTLFRAKVFDERDIHRSAIEITVEIQEVDLEKDRSAIKCWPYPEVGRRIVPGRAPRLDDTSAHGIDTQRGLKMITELQIGGGEAEISTPGIAMFHYAVDRPPAPQRFGRIAGPTAL